MKSGIFITSSQEVYQSGTERALPIIQDDIRIRFIDLWHQSDTRRKDRDRRWLWACTDSWLICHLNAYAPAMIRLGEIDADSCFRADDAERTTFDKEKLQCISTL